MKYRFWTWNCATVVIFVLFLILAFAALWRSVHAMQMPAGIYDWMTVEVIPEVHYVLSGTPASKTVFWKNRDADFGHATTDKETGAITVRRYYIKE